MFKKASDVNELTGIQFLSELVGPIRRIKRLPIKTVGFSGTTHERLQLELANGEIQSLILKDIHSEHDLSVWRMGNMYGREARVLQERSIDNIWKIFHPPFLAYFFDDEHSGLLMKDLSDSLFPDVREPLRIDEEELLLKTFAKLHAEFWENSQLVNLPWLASGSMYFDFLSPNVPGYERVKGRMNPVFDAAEAGWNHAQTILPENLWELLNRPAAELYQIGSDLPKTLLHGDAKVANFAIDHHGKVNAFDFAMIAHGSPACEIGWYITVNATRLTRPKEAVFDFYKNELEKNLGFSFSDSDWRRMESMAILTGAITLLWSKALNLKKELPGSGKEWEWWVTQIEMIHSEYLS